MIWTWSWIRDTTNSSLFLLFWLTTVRDYLLDLLVSKSPPHSCAVPGVWILCIKSKWYMSVNGAFKVTNQQICWSAFRISYQMINCFSGPLLGISFTTHVHESFHDWSFSALSKVPIISCSVSSILKGSGPLCWHKNWSCICNICTNAVGGKELSFLASFFYQHKGCVELQWSMLWGFKFKSNLLWLHW